MEEVEAIASSEESLQNLSEDEEEEEEKKPAKRTKKGKAGAKKGKAAGHDEGDNPKPAKIKVRMSLPDVRIPSPFFSPLSPLACGWVGGR